MKIHHVAQGSLDWYRLRLGIPTASRFDKIITPTGKASAQATKYQYRLIAERLLRETMDDQIGNVRWIEHGKEEEPNAVAQFQLVNDVELVEVGFITTDDGRIGCSPDRLLKGHHEAVEIKCPAPWTQIGYLLDGPGADYRPQVQGQLLIGRFDLVHFYSYHRRMPPLHVETQPDILFQGLLHDALQRFLDELDERTERARSLGAYVVMPEHTPLERAYPDAEADPLEIMLPE
jgi:hypothetical protein